MRPWRPITLPTSSGSDVEPEDGRAVLLDRLDAHRFRVVDQMPCDPGEELGHDAS